MKKKLLIIATLTTLIVIGHLAYYPLDSDDSLDIWVGSLTYMISVGLMVAVPTAFCFELGKLTVRAAFVTGRFIRSHYSIYKLKKLKNLKDLGIYSEAEYLIKSDELKKYI
jgi:hypothetical protein